MTAANGHWVVGPTTNDFPTRGCQHPDRPSPEACVHGSVWMCGDCGRRFKKIESEGYDVDYWRRTLTRVHRASRASAQ